MDSIYNVYKPFRMVMFFNVLAFTLMFLHEDKKDFITLAWGIGIILLIFGVYVLIKWRHWGDEYLFLISSMLVSIGLMMIYRLDPDIGKRQIVWFAGGASLFLLSYLIFNLMPMWNSKKLYYIYPAASFLLFTLTLAYGRRIGGAINWLSIAGINIQPLEVIKLLFIFFTASYYKHRESLKALSLKIKGNDFRIKSIYIYGVLSYIHMGFLVLQREWGGALLFFLIYFTLLYIFESNLKFMLANVFFAGAGSLGGILFLSHIQTRIDIWLNPWADISGKGYQITQSLFAIGSGGFFGTGIGLGSPELIPEVHTDFIFSAICEEMGIFGGTGVILLYLLLVYRGIKISLKINDIFYKALALGISIMIGFQTFIIIGGVVKMIPLTGITLPFISYGGSSLISSFIALGILQAISSGKSIQMEETHEGE
ncbi:MAG TPA: cell cycle protein [Eubacteriaceae bacterium]|nr:cell cycle protein [Eubacteriaceae bacterium]